MRTLSPGTPPERVGTWTRTPREHPHPAPPLILITVSLMTTASSSVPIPTVSPLLSPVTSRNILLLQSLPNSIPYRQDNVRRRKDAHRVGTATRGSTARL